MEDRYEFREEIRLWFDELLRSNKTFDNIGKVIKSFERDSRTLTKQQKNLIARELDKGEYQSLLSSSDDLDDEEMFPTPLTQPTQDDDELMEEQSIRNGEPRTAGVAFRLLHDLFHLLEHLRGAASQVRHGVGCFVEQLLSKRLFCPLGAGP